MKKPVLVIMAAGMGSRYGGLKQIDPVDEQGHIIMDFSLYDAKRAGFAKVVFIIKHENEEDFKKISGLRKKGGFAELADSPKFCLWQGEKKFIIKTNSYRKNLERNGVCV